MSVSDASASDLGLSQMNAPLGFAHRIDRARQIVERQRELVAKLGERSPIAAALLKNFESTLLLFEKCLANHGRANELLAASEDRAVLGSKASVAAPIEQAGADPLALEQEQARALAHLMETLREGGYQFEVRYVSLN